MFKTTPKNSIFKRQTAYDCLVSCLAHHSLAVLGHGAGVEAPNLSNEVLIGQSSATIFGHVQLQFYGVLL